MVQNYVKEASVFNISGAFLKFYGRLWLSNNECSVSLNIIGFTQIHYKV